MLMAMLYGAKGLRTEQRRAASGKRTVKGALRRGRHLQTNDLSYYGKGRVGDFAVMQPLCASHEVSGGWWKWAWCYQKRRSRGDQRTSRAASATCDGRQGASVPEDEFLRCARCVPHIQGRISVR